MICFVVWIRFNHFMFCALLSFSRIARKESPWPSQNPSHLNATWEHPFRFNRAVNRKDLENKSKRDVLCKLGRWLSTRIAISVSHLSSVAGLSCNFHGNLCIRRSTTITCVVLFFCVACKSKQKVFILVKRKQQVGRVTSPFLFLLFAIHFSNKLEALENFWKLHNPHKVFLSLNCFRTYYCAFSDFFTQCL